MQEGGVCEEQGQLKEERRERRGTPAGAPYLLDVRSLVWSRPSSR